MRLGSPTYKYIEAIVNAIDLSIKVKSVTNPSTGIYVLVTSCGIKWATKGFSVTIDGNNYSIQDIDSDAKTITVKGSVALSGSFSFDLFSPQFYHGTVVSVDNDINDRISKGLKVWTKLPMIFLHESVDESYNYQPTEAILKNSDVDLYFMSMYDPKDWPTNDHYKYAIEPMRRLIDEFNKSMELGRVVSYKNIDKFRVNDYARWGARISATGYEKKPFEGFSLSGCKVSTTLPILRKNICDC